MSRRHTSFASAWVYPVVDETIEVEVLDKDLRTGVETGNVQAVLDGDIDGFLEPSLAARLERGGEAEGGQEAGA